MASWYAMECDHADTWSMFSEIDEEPTGDDLLCPEAGHPAVTLSASPLGRYVRITIAAASGPPTSRSTKRSKFFFELSTWDGNSQLRSRKPIDWETAVKRAELFHNLSWEDAERRWRHLRM